jgi:hypothetical protein
MNDEVVRHSLDTLPGGLRLSGVTARIAHIAGREALRIELTDDVTVNGKPNIDYVDMPTFAALPLSFTNGVISVDILSRLNALAPDYARAFAGLAYRIADNFNTFESAYLRPLNGTSLNPPAPRDRRAVQYFAYPDWRFERLRETYPDGRHEAGANIVPTSWINLCLHVNEQSLVVYVNNKQVLAIAQTKAATGAGMVGLFVDIGTEAYFSNLEMTPL